MSSTGHSGAAVPVHRALKLSSHAMATRNDPGVRVTRGAGSGQHLASVLQEGRENANIGAGLAFIWRISVNTITLDEQVDAQPLIMPNQSIDRLITDMRWNERKCSRAPHICVLLLIVAGGQKSQSAK